MLCSGMDEYESTSTSRGAELVDDCDPNVISDRECFQNDCFVSRLLN